MTQFIVLALGAIFAIAGIILFAKKGTSGKNTIKMFGAEFQLAGSSLVVFVVGCILIIIATKLDRVSDGNAMLDHVREEAEQAEKNTKSPPGTESPATSRVLAAATPPEFVTAYVYKPDEIQRVEFDVATGVLPQENIDDFLRVSHIAFGQDHKTFNVRLIIKNTGTRPLQLDLNERYFGLEDDQGRSAKLVYFCCIAEGELLAVNGEREVQLFFESSEWYGKEISAHSIFFRIRGFLPVSRASWKFPALATAS